MSFSNQKSMEAENIVNGFIQEDYQRALMVENEKKKKIEEDLRLTQI